MNYQKINAEAIDTWCLDGWVWGQPISHELYQNAQKGNGMFFLLRQKLFLMNGSAVCVAKKCLVLQAAVDSRFLFLLPSEQIVPYWIILPNNVQVSS